VWNSDEQKPLVFSRSLEKLRKSFPSSSSSSTRDLTSIVIIVATAAAFIDICRFHNQFHRGVKWDFTLEASMGIITVVAQISHKKIVSSFFLLVSLYLISVCLHSQKLSWFLLGILCTDWKGKKSSHNHSREGCQTEKKGGGLDQKSKNCMGGGAIIYWGPIRALITCWYLYTTVS